MVHGQMVIGSFLSRRKGTAFFAIIQIKSASLWKNLHFF